MGTGRIGSVGLLVGLILLVGSAGLFLAFVPCVECPALLHKTPVFDGVCQFCGGRDYVTLARKWMPTPEKRRYRDTTLESVLAADAALTKDQAAKELVLQLRSDALGERNHAARDLKSLGEAAIGQLQKATSGTEDRVSRHATEIIRDITDPSGAEKSFEQLEKAVLRARSLKVTFRFREEAEGPGASHVGTLRFREGNKLHFVFPALGDGLEQESTFISNGSKAVSSTIPGVVMEVPEDSDRLARKILVRLGAAACHLLPTLLGSDTDRESFSETYLQVSEFGYGSPPLDKKDRALVFQLVNPGDTWPHDHWVSFDPENFRIIEHQDTGPWHISGRGYEETYLEFVLNEDLPDEEFRLPTEKR
jgi:hypothetical protein